MSENTTSMQVRIDHNLKKVFISCCKNQDITASQELRKYMREYIAKNGQGKLL
jgi:antitoxin component of RelBE/YafQ-DinJ toxin-antitoxin module